jgi:hypothetical protein
MRHLFATLLFCFSSYASFAVSGASIQTITLDQKTASITVLNTSDRDITGYTVALTATFEGGRERRSEYTTDYGPLTGKVLRAHQTATEPYQWQEAPLTVDGKVIVVIYNNGTAEADTKETLNQIVSVRAAIAKALRFSADTLNAALSYPKPSEYARVRLQAIVAEKDKSFNQSYLQGTLSVVEDASKNTQHERDILQANAARFDKEATAFQAYANVRRLP